MASRPYPSIDPLKALRVAYHREIRHTVWLRYYCCRNQATEVMRDEQIAVTAYGRPSRAGLLHRRLQEAGIYPSMPKSIAHVEAGRPRTLAASDSNRDEPT
jgi:hypothetical protein